MDAVKFVTVIDAQGIGRFAKSKCKQTITLNDWVMKGISWASTSRIIFGACFCRFWGRAGEAGVRKADAGEERVGGELLLSFRFIPAS